MCRFSTEMSKDAMIEVNLEEPVRAFLTHAGCIVHRQSALGTGIPDLLGYHRLLDSFIAVELKLVRLQQAVRQAKGYLWHAHYAFVAMPMEIAKRIACDTERWSVLTENGIGLLGVDSSHVDILIAGTYHNAERYMDLYPRFQREINRAGMP